jgi:inorganic pyrophosphatase
MIRSLQWHQRTFSNHYKNIKSSPAFFAELKNYFEQYKVLENKKVEIDNFQDKEAALKIIMDSIDYYKQTFEK